MFCCKAKKTFGIETEQIEHGVWGSVFVKKW